MHIDFDVKQNLPVLHPKKGTRRTNAGLDPYIPSPQKPWDMTRASHLLRRTLFLPTYDQIKFALTKTPGEVVDLLLQDLPLPPAPGAWIDEIPTKPVTDPERAAYQSTNLSRMNALRAWWCDLMRSDQFSVIEKMTLFWHGHITGEGKEVLLPQFMYIQNQLLREYALENFRSMMKRVNYDAAMLRYLGGDINVKGKPNENYARELQELFTIGLDHYTEQDIKEVARCLTGWQLDEFMSLDPYFNPLYHDAGNKTFMGRTILGRSSVDGRFEADEVVDIIFERQEVATFICTKLYKFFVYDNPSAVDPVIVAGLAEIFRQNNYEIKPVLAALLKSEHFFDDVNIGVVIKSPADHFIGLYRQLELSASGSGIVNEMKSAEQWLLDPPNVSGWEGYRTWISTNTYPIRKSSAEKGVNGLKPDIVSFVKKFSNYQNVDVFLDTLLAVLLPKPVSTKRRDVFLATLLNGAYAYEWGIDDPRFQLTTTNVLLMIVNSPDYQLH